MGLKQIHEDVHYLAGRLLDRTALGDGEREAANYLRDRFLLYTPDVEIDRFDTIDSYHSLFASFYIEFVLVAFLAWWWPLFAFIYGAGVFLLYLAEVMGFRTLSRLLPKFESQNVTARFMGRRARNLFVITANYDSGQSSFLSLPRVVPWLNIAHNFVVLAMVTLLAACALLVMNVDSASALPYPHIVRWAAGVVMLAAALIMLYAGHTTEDCRGANANASGVAALLQIAAKLRDAPIDTADVWLVATGAHSCWMSGMRHFLDSHSLDRQHTYVINLECVGTGKLSYLTAEGFIHLNQASKPLVQEAKSHAARFGARAAQLRALPTANHMTFARGIPAMTVIGLDLLGLPRPWNTEEDRITAVEDKQIACAAEFTEAILRGCAERAG